MQIEIIIPMLIIMKFFKVTHQKVYLSVKKCEHNNISDRNLIGSDDRNFSSDNHAEKLFLKGPQL